MSGGYITAHVIPDTHTESIDHSLQPATKNLYPCGVAAAFTSAVLQALPWMNVSRIRLR